MLYARMFKVFPVACITVYGGFAGGLSVWEWVMAAVFSGVAMLTW